MIFSDRINKTRDDTQEKASLELRGETKKLKH